MKKTIIASTALSLILLTNFSFAAKNEFERIRDDLPKASNEVQRKTFESYINKGSKNQKILPMIGYMYYHGIGTNVDRNTALNMYKRSAESGNSQGMYLLGRYYVEELGQIEDGLKELVKATDLNNQYAAEFIAHMYEDGKYVDKNDYYALEYYYRASKLGSSEARLIIAKKLLDSGDEKNYAKGIEFLKSAAELDNVEACLTLSKLYITENSFIPLDPQRHVSSLICAADNGNPEAMKTLADYYARGVIVMIDNKRSAAYYNKYIETIGKAPKTQDEAEAFYNAGIASYSNKKYKQALDYFKLASKGGNTDATMALARMHEHGYGVKQDINQAINYYKMAQRNGIDNSENILRLESLKENKRK